MYIIADGQSEGKGDTRNQTRQSYRRAMLPVPSSGRIVSSLSSVDLQVNPSYQPNSRARSKTPLGVGEIQRMMIHQPDPSRQDITRQDPEELCCYEDSIASYEDNSYVIMTSTETNGTLQSSGAYESML